MGMDGSSKGFLRLGNKGACLEVIRKEPLDRKKLKIRERLKMIEMTICWKRQNEKGSFVPIEGFAFTRTRVTSLYETEVKWREWQKASGRCELRRGKEEDLGK